MATINVIAPPGLKCPKPHKRGEFYTDSETVTVPHDMDHRRLIADGSLLIASTVKTKTAKEVSHD